MDEVLTEVPTILPPRRILPNGYHNIIRFFTFELHITRQWLRDVAGCKNAVEVLKTLNTKFNCYTLTQALQDIPTRIELVSLERAVWYRDTLPSEHFTPGERHPFDWVNNWKIFNTKPKPGECFYCRDALTGRHIAFCCVDCNNRFDAIRIMYPERYKAKWKGLAFYCMLCSKPVKIKEARSGGRCEKCKDKKWIKRLRR